MMTSVAVLSGRYTCIACATTDGNTSRKHHRAIDQVIHPPGLGAFEAIVIMGEEDRQDWKPSKIPFERLLAEMDLQGDQAAYIGDNPLKDFVGARQLKMLTIWVRRPEGEHVNDLPPGPEYLAEIELPDLNGLSDALEGKFT